MLIHLMGSISPINLEGRLALSKWLSGPEWFDDLVSPMVCNFPTREECICNDVMPGIYDQYLRLPAGVRSTLDRLLLDGWAGTWDDLVACAWLLGPEDVTKL